MPGHQCSPIDAMLDWVEPGTRATTRAQQSSHHRIDIRLDVIDLGCLLVAHNRALAGYAWCTGGWLWSSVIIAASKLITTTH